MMNGEEGATRKQIKKMQQEALKTKTEQLAGRSDEWNPRARNSKKENDRKTTTHMSLRMKKKYKNRPNANQTH